MKRQEDSTSRTVSDLLHTLRGEQFRHARNQLNQRRLPPAAQRGPTLPPELEYLTSANETSTSSPLAESVKHFLPADPVGPNMPKSWIERDYRDKAQRASRAWRAQALSIVLNSSACAVEGRDIKTALDMLDTSPLLDGGSTMPSMTMLCLRVLLASYSSSPSVLIEDVIPFLPPHLRRRLLRWSCIHHPLSNSLLYALCEPDGHANGEFIVVGKAASLRGGHFQEARKRLKQTTASESTSGDPLRDISLVLSGTDGDADEKDISWEAQDNIIQEPIHTLALVSVSLTNLTVLTFPPTLTHLALIDIETSIPLRRLPLICPLIVVLDLSYNSWLRNVPSGNLEQLHDIPWTKWSRLRLLGLRGCTRDNALDARVNGGRWDDVDIIYEVLSHNRSVESSATKTEERSM